MIQLGNFGLGLFGLFSVGLLGSAIAKSQSDIAEEKRRKSIPCRFDSLISQSRFTKIANSAKNGIPRLTNITVNRSIVTGTVKSNSGLSKWNFTIDFNDYGSVTGKYWITSENEDSNIPLCVAEKIKDEIKSILNSGASLPNRENAKFETDCTGSFGEVERRFCPHCGKRTVLSDIKFCTHCGKSVDDSIVQPTSTHETSEQIVNLNCENCNAHLELDLDNMMAYCPYCGQKLLLNLDRIENILAERERTKRQQEETARTQMRYEYTERREKRESASSLKGLLLVVLFVFLSLGFLHLMLYQETCEHKSRNDIYITVSAKDIKGENYEDAVRIFKSAGFDNIELIQKDDLIVGIFAKEGTVDSVTINGHSSFSNGDWFPADAVVKITYHTFPEKS